MGSHTELGDPLLQVSPLFGSSHTSWLTGARQLGFLSETCVIVDLCDWNPFSGQGLERKERESQMKKEGWGRR